MIGMLLSVFSGKVVVLARAKRPQHQELVQVKPQPHPAPARAKQLQPQALVQVKPQPLQVLARVKRLQHQELAQGRRQLQQEPVAAKVQVKQPPGRV
jgi:hypothetical protein